MALLLGKRKGNPSIAVTYHSIGLPEEQLLLNDRQHLHEETFVLCHFVVLVKHSGQQRWL